MQRTRYGVDPCHRQWAHAIRHSLHHQQRPWSCRAATTASAVSHVVTTATATPVWSSPPASALNNPRRWLWNPFSAFAQKSGSGGAAAASGRDSPSTATASANATQHTRIIEKAHREATLHNERLVDACLELLDLCGGTNTGDAPSTRIDAPSREQVWAVVDVLLHQHRCRPSEQFDCVYFALCTSAARENRQVQRCLFILLDSVLPEALYRVFESVNLIVVGEDEQSMQRRDVLLQFMHAMLGDLKAPVEVEEEEVMMVYLDDVATAFPLLVSSPAWKAVAQDATSIALKAKLFALLGQLCAEFDKDGTGKVRLVELQETAERVLGKQQAALLLDGAPVDANGMIVYPQLAALLTRPPPRA